MLSITAGFCIILAVFAVAVATLTGGYCCGEQMSDESEMLHRECHPAEDLDLKDHAFSSLMARVARFEEGDACELPLTDKEMSLLLSTGRARQTKEYR